MRLMACLSFAACVGLVKAQSPREFNFQLNGPVSSMRVSSVKELRQLALPEHFESDCRRRAYNAVVRFDSEGRPTYSEDVSGDTRTIHKFSGEQQTEQVTISPQGKQTAGYSNQVRNLNPNTTEQIQKVRETAPGAPTTEHTQNDIVERRIAPNTTISTNLARSDAFVDQHSTDPEERWQENVFVGPNGSYRREKLFYKYPHFSWLERAQALDQHGEVLIDVRIRPDKTIESVELSPRCTGKDPDPSCRLTFAGANAKHAVWGYSFDPRVGFFGDATQPMLAGEMQVGTKQTYRIHDTEYHFENHYIAIDTHGNWTTEVCSMLDPKTGTLIDYEQVDRVLEYEPQK